MSTLFKKKRYKIHYLLLKQALQLGYKLTKVHRAMSFTQERFSQDFLNFMTGRRKNAKSKLEERQCKVVFWYFVKFFSHFNLISLFIE